MFRGEISSERDSPPESKVFQLPVFFTYAKPPSHFSQKRELKFQAVLGLTASTDIGLGYKLDANFRLSDPTKVIRDWVRCDRFTM